MLLLLFVTFLWSTGFIFAKGLIDVLPVSVVYIIRFGISFLLFYLFYRKKIVISRSTFKAGLLIGSVNAAAMILMFLGLQYTTASNSAFITSIFVVVLPFLELHFYHKKPGLLIWLGVAVATLGVYLMAVSGGGHFTVNIGDVLTLVCGIIFAYQIFFITHYTKKENTYGLIAMQFGVNTIAGILLFVFYDVLGKVGLPDCSALVSPKIIGILIAFAVTATLIPFAVQFHIQKKVSASVAGLAYVSEPVFAVTLAIIILKEMPTGQQWVGIALIMLSLVAAHFSYKHEE